jgi:hypothetical protein
VLHVRDDRPAEGRRVLAPRSGPPQPRAGSGRDRRPRVRRRPTRRADVPCERLGPALHLHDDRSHAGPSRAAPRCGEPVRSLHPRARHVHRGRADYLARSPPQARRTSEGVRPVAPSPPRGRRLGRAEVDDPRLRRAARPSRPPRLGHDRDHAARRRVQPDERPRASRRGDAPGISRQAGLSGAAGGDPRSERQRAGGALGREVDGRARGARPTASPPTAGSRPATSSRSTRAATWRSRTAPRT